MNSIDTRELAAWLDQTLQPGRFRDYGPNGLQSGRQGVDRPYYRRGDGIRGLVAHGHRPRRDAVLVHHGWFWKNEDPRVRGPRRTRLALALGHDLNLFAYHLPLDAHPQLGNNAQLARVLGLVPERDAAGLPRTCGQDNLVVAG